jgi:hypothetical protein
MKLAVRLCLLCLVLSAVSAFAGIVGSTNPSLFPDTIDWCAQSSFACDGNQYTTSQLFTSSSGAIGLIGLPFNGFDFQALQAGTTLFGSSFPDGMGVVYNGVSTLGNPQDAIALLFAQPQYGAGAYIQTWFYGPFTAEVDLFDTSGNLIGFYDVNGVSSDQSSDLLFIGAIDPTGRNVAAALFLAQDSGGFFDFEIGQAGLATPEPSSILLIAPSVLGLYGMIRRRRSRKSQEVL